jgi:hypothetical protein
MGIALSNTEPGSRSKLASAAFTAIGLAFFFGVGLAGGAAYKIYFADTSGPQVAEASPPPALPAAAPAEQNLAATPSPVAEIAAEKAAPDAAPMAASAPAALEPQPAPTAEASEPAMMAQAAPPPVPSAPEPALQAAAAEPPAPPAMPQAIPEVASAPPPPDASAALQQAISPPATAIPPKPASAAKAHRAPQTAASHPPPAAQASAAGHFHVQFGAFANEDNARRVQWAVEATGLNVEVRHEPSPSGNPLFFVRSPSYPDRAAAVNAAQAAQNRAQHLANPVRIDYAIIPDRAAAPERHAQR